MLAVDLGEMRGHQVSPPAATLNRVRCIVYTRPPGEKVCYKMPLTHLVVVGLFAELDDLLVPGLPGKVGSLVLPPGGYFVNHGPGSRPRVHCVPRGTGARVVELSVADIFILREWPIPLLVFRLVFPGCEIN